MCQYICVYVGERSFILADAFKKSKLLNSAVKSSTKTLCCLIQRDSYAQFHLKILPAAMPPTQPAATPERLTLDREPRRSAPWHWPASFEQRTFLPFNHPKRFLTMDEVNYSASLPSRSHRGQLYQPDYSSQPELRRVENAVPLAASLGTEQASAVWSPSQAQANLACRGLRRIGLMKYIYDLLQTCIVPRYCVLSGRLHPDGSPALQSETVQCRLCGSDAQGMQRALSLQTGVVTHISPAPCLKFEAVMSEITKKHFFFCFFSHGCKMERIQSWGRLLYLNGSTLKLLVKISTF